MTATTTATTTIWTGWPKISLLPCPRCGWKTLKPTSKTGKYKIYIIQNKQGRILKLVFRCQSCKYETEVTTHESTTGLQYNIQVRQTTPVRDFNDLVERSRWPYYRNP